MGGTPPRCSGLVVIARDTTGSIVTRMSSKRDLLGAMNTPSSAKMTNHMLSSSCCVPSPLVPAGGNGGAPTR